METQTFPRSCKMMSDIVIAAFIILTPGLTSHEAIAADTNAPSFWTIQNKDATAERISELTDTLTTCKNGFAGYFPHTPEKLTIFAYGSQASLVDGLIKELGFSKEGTAFFAHGGAPRPLNGKLLVPPEMDSNGICHEVAYS